MGHLHFKSGRRRARIPYSDTARPTTSRLRSSLFDMLVHACFRRSGAVPFRGLKVLDAFAGTGALGLEALIRDASHVTFVEQDAQNAQAIDHTLGKMNFLDRSTVHKAFFEDIAQLPHVYDVIFLDPPYGEGMVSQALDLISKKGWIQREGWIVCEHELGAEIECPPQFSLIREKRIRKSCLSFLQYQE